LLSENAVVVRHISAALARIIMKNCILILVIVCRILGEKPSNSNEDINLLNIRSVPEKVLNYINKNKPGYHFPDYSLFKANYLKSIIIKNDFWPPFCIEGNFNNDTIKDYVLLLTKDTIDTIGNKSYVNCIVILHGTINNFKEIPLPKKTDLNNCTPSLGMRRLNLGVLKAGKYTRSVVTTTEIIIHTDAIYYSSMFSGYYWLWGGKEYQEHQLWED
jgi:hypothetical protein